MESNYRVAYDLEWNKLKKLELLDLVKRLDVKYNGEREELIVPFFEKDYILDFKNQSIYGKKDGCKPSISDSIIILNYLTHSKDYIINTKNWVSLKEIPNGGALFYPAFYKTSILHLVESFGSDIQSFKECSLKLGGREIKFGDRGYEFKVLPKISICVAIWEGDEEISPNAAILFEPSIQYLLHIETIIGAGMCVAEKLIDIKM